MLYLITATCGTLKLLGLKGNKEVFEELIQKNMSVKFKCEPAGGKAGEYVAVTHSELFDPSSKAIEEVEATIGSIAPDLVEFFRKHNGALFHADSENLSAGIHLHPIEEWDELRSDMMEWYDMMDEDVLDEINTDWLEDCIVFGEVPSSANYFVLVVNGVHKGKVIYSDHEVAEQDVYTNSFNELLTKYLSDPVGEIMSLGCFTRYDDGKTNIQWIPREII